MTAKDIAILRDLAKEVREEAHLPRMDELRRKWQAHNDLESRESMVLLELGGMLNEAVPENTLLCEDAGARSVERNLRARLVQTRVVGDDLVIDDELRVNVPVRQAGWRERARSRWGESKNGVQAGYVPIPLLNDPREIFDMPKSVFFADREGAMREMAFWEDILGDILHVRLRGNYWWTLGMTGDFLRLTGMETFFTLPYDDEEAFHGIMRFLMDDALALVDFLENEGLFTLNNGNDYVGSGGTGFTSCLPAKDYAGHVRAKDLWCLLESQESSSMAPAMFRDLIFPYQLEVAKRFGLIYYGCCEPIHDRFDTIAKIPNLRTLSVSPWCDMKALASKLDRRYVLACKPSPALISHGFEEDALRAHVREAKHAFGDSTMEFVMKDVHTVQCDLTRARRWVELVREETQG